MEIDRLDHLVLTVADLGAPGAMISVYFRNPDGNPLESASYHRPPPRATAVARRKESTK